jgi:RNA polymerase sigma-70 factor, ECF subfamily
MITAPEPQDDNRQLAVLIARARDGDVLAFEEMYNATARWLLARVRRYVDDGQAEDVLTEVYLQVWKSLDSFDAGRAPARVWLAVIARARALDHLRRERRRDQVQGCPQMQAQAEDSLDDGPEQLLSELEQRHMMQVSLAGAPLSDTERTVIGLAYFRDCTQLEIASETGLPLGTVKTLIARAQSKLRAQHLMCTPRWRLPARQCL